MTTENKSIWHTPDASPSVFNNYSVLVLYEAGNTPEIMSSKDYFRLTHNRYVNLWCYWDDFIKYVAATSKALYVAIDSLDAIKDWDADNPKDPFNMRTYQVRAIQNFARNKIHKISEIMKGDKI